jgi:hypothetical protein
VLDRQRGGVDLLPGVGRQLAGEVGSQLTVPTKAGPAAARTAAAGEMVVTDPARPLHVIVCSKLISGINARKDCVILTDRHDDVR